MPRDLGHAKRADLTGHFAGEPSEQVSSLTNFLVAASQLSPPADGAHPGGNGRHETDTEVSGRQTEVPHTHTDTEVAGRLHPGGNGHAHDTVFDSPLPSLDMEPEAMEPEPLLTPEPMLAPEPAGLAPTGAPELGARTEMLRPPVVPAPTPLPEPEALDSIPDFASPEHDAPLLDEEGAEPVTDKLPPRKPAAAVPDLPPPANAGDTGMLMMEAEATPEANQLSLEELRADEDTNLQAGFDPSEKITSKVEARVDTDPRSRDPDAVVRDTVNFYNQTQSLHGARQGAAAAQSVPGTVPLAPRPREFEDSPSRRFTPPPPMPSLAAEPEELPTAPTFDSDDLAAEPMPDLSADDEIESADRKDTDRFLEDDRRPPDLPKPMGADKAAPAPRKPAVAGQPATLDAVAPEKVAAGKDTQKFFVADILRKKDEPKPAARLAPTSSESTGELQPETARPPAGESSTDTAFEVGTEQQSTVREPKPVPELDLPESTEVEKDFDTNYYGKSDERIIPEYAGVPEEAKGQAEPGADETGEVPQAPETPERITEKVSKAEEALPQPAPARPAASGRPAVASSAGRMPTAASTPRIAPAPAAVPAVAAQRTKTPRVSDEVSRRLAAEREETMKLLDAAEQLASRLRTASEQSRVDLVAISARRRAAPPPEVSFEPEPAPVDSQPTRILSARDYPLDEKPTAPVPAVMEADAVHLAEPAPVPQSRSRRERVPTQAIGDIVSAIESKLGQGDEPLSELLQEASRRITRRIEAETGGNGNGNGNGHSEPEDDDVDVLVAASGSWRALLGPDEPADVEQPPPRVESNRVAAQSPLAQDLDRMWKELSTRKAAVVSSVEPARISRRLDPGLGWTQEALWKTLVGISLVTFALGGLFVWVVYRLLS